MTRRQAEEILKTIKFLHYKFTLVGGELESREAFFPSSLGAFYNPLYCEECRLLITLSSPDTRDRTQMLDLTHSLPCYLEMLTPQTFVTFVFDCVIRTVRHEIGELFTVNGQDPFNEHHTRSSKDILGAMFQADHYPVPNFNLEKWNSISARIKGYQDRYILPPLDDQA